MVHLRHYNPPHRIFGNPPLINQPNIQDSFSASLSYYASIIKLSKAESLSPPTEQASYSALGGFCRHKEHSVVWDFPNHLAGCQPSAFGLASGPYRWLHFHVNALWPSPAKSDALGLWFYLEQAKSDSIAYIGTQHCEVKTMKVRKLTVCHTCRARKLGVSLLNFPWSLDGVPSPVILYLASR